MGLRNYPLAFLDVFDAIFVLEVDPATLHRRLDQRADDEFGSRARQAERDLVVRLHSTGEGIPDGMAIDATAPLTDVVDEVLRLAAMVDENAR